jgi:hypothetical protein
MLLFKQLFTFSKCVVPLDGQAGAFQSGVTWITCSEMKLRTVPENIRQISKCNVCNVGLQFPNFLSGNDLYQLGIFALTEHILH